MTDGKDSENRKSQKSFTISALVPTYRRPGDLKRCLDGLKAQIRPADEIVVVARPDDLPTWDVLKEYAASFPALRTIAVTRSGQIQALNAGVMNAACDLIAITDDDAVPHPDWLERIERAFLGSEDVAGVGGRDLMPHLPPPAKLEPVVGRVQWFGRHIGNHHLGCGGPRPVHVLKGVNCAYRASLLKRIRFDETLRGEGAQVHNELMLGLTLVREGWALIYDPQIQVDHFLAVRHDPDQRGTFNARALENEAHNETLAIWRFLPLPQRLVYFIWSLLVGTRRYPGLLCWLEARLRNDPIATERLKAAWRGRAAAWTGHAAPPAPLSRLWAAGPRS